MNIKEVRKAVKLIPNFVMMCQNDLGEEEQEHKIKNLLTFEEYEEVVKLMQYLKICYDYVDVTIFE